MAEERTLSTSLEGDAGTIVLTVDVEEPPGAIDQTPAPPLAAPPAGPAAIPEPSALVLVGLGLLRVVLLIGRRSWR